MLELQDVEQPVVRWASKNRWFHLKINGLGKRGFPDQFFFGKPRLLVMIEFKRPGSKPRPLQTKVHAILRGLGWPVHVVDTVEKGIAVLTEARMDTEAVPGRDDRADA